MELIFDIVVAIIVVKVIFWVFAAIAQMIHEG
jgi:hypothetical protein